MRQPTWNEFKGKNPKDSAGAFEALCRLLFRTRYGIGDSLPYFYNNAGDETVPITEGNEIIGFQCKFFSGNTITGSQARLIKHSIERTHTHYPNQTKIIVYTNLTFGNPKAGNLKTSRQQDVEKSAKDNSLTIEWMFGDNILDAVANNELAYDLFFDIYSNTSKLPNSVKKQNERNFRNIDTAIKFAGQEISFDRSQLVTTLSESLDQKKHVIISGESGSGKSAIVKRYWEVLPEADHAFYMLNGIQFSGTSVDGLFNMDETFTFSRFKIFYAGTSQKVLFIDSAEKLLEQPNLHTFQTIIDELSKTGWTFVFTCITICAERLGKLLANEGMTTIELKVDEIDEKELDTIIKQYQIPVPKNDKVKKQIRIPFYLARYCELDLKNTGSLSSFRDNVWNRKVRGTTFGPAQQKREECLIRIVREQQAKRAYLVSIPDLDHEAAFALEIEDVITNYGHKGYAIKHDIYIDWTLDYVIERDFDTPAHCLKQLKDAPVSVSYSNAFKRWLSGRIDRGEECIEQVVGAFIAGETDRQWASNILSSIGGSLQYASQFFSKNEESLKETDYGLFTRFVDVLHVYCQEVRNIFEYNGKEYSVTAPSGAGWDEAVKFLYANKERYYMGHLNSAYKVLDAYCSLGDMAKERQKAAELSLYLFDEIAKVRQAGGSFWMKNSKPWCLLVCSYAITIKGELQERFRQVIENRWVEHRDPYAELVAFILRDCEYINFLYPVCEACTKEVVELMELIWREQPPKPEKYSWPFRSDHENDYNHDYWFGLNKDFDNGLYYFPASGIRTPLAPLLAVEQKYHAEDLPVTKFLVKFINECVECYSKRCTQNHEAVECIEVLTPQGKRHELLSSLGLWTLYRGIGNISAPYLITSLHMALEMFLLKLITGPEKGNEENRKHVHKITRYILDNSRSVSLYSVIASIAMAEPHEFFDELLIVCQDIRFLSYDMSRYSCEQTSGIMTMGLPIHEQMNEERNKSNGYPHRQIYLERILLDRQMVYDDCEGEEAKERLERAFAVVDSLKEQVEGAPQACTNYEFIIARVDYRSMDKKFDQLRDGRKVVQLIPKLSKKLQKVQQNTQQYEEGMRGMNLHFWAEKMYEGDEKVLNGLDFGKDVRQVLSDISTVEAWCKAEALVPMCLEVDEYAPYMASAILLMKRQDDLAVEEKEECWERVIRALRSPGTLVAHSMTGINICLSAIPDLIALRPEEGELYSSIMASYAMVKEEYVNTRICDILSSMIVDGDLWNKYPIVMDGALEHLLRDMQKDDLQEFTPEQATAILCLLTFKTNKRVLGDKCVVELASLWEPSSYHSTSLRSYHDSNMVAQYILNAPVVDVDRLIAPYARLFDAKRDYETILSSVLIYAVNSDKYENFWRVWYAFMEPLKRTARNYGNSQQVNTYLLNPPYLNPASENWFRLEEKDIVFFEKVVEDLDDNPAVLYALSKVFTTFGKPFAMRVLSLFAKIADAYGQSGVFEDVRMTVIMNLELYVTHIYDSYKREIRTDSGINRELEKVLRFMINNGSQTAAALIEKL
ncbi:MAG: ATP-binding protein [Bacteroidales bacterium]|nr:ATP-binding protein [Bacteroidales bacterium]